jgi:hypothetical protein
MFENLLFRQAASRPTLPITLPEAQSGDAKPLGGSPRSLGLLGGTFALLCLAPSIAIINHNLSYQSLITFCIIYKSLTHLIDKIIE